MPIRILGIESSCDESSAAIIDEKFSILAESTARQEEVHQRWGGIVPELASRKHTESLLPVVQHTLFQSGLGYGDISAVAVTNRPGLIGALLVGVSAAKAIAYSLQKPLILINHLEAHLAAVLLSGVKLEQLQFPVLGLIISGGHTSLYRIENEFLDFTLLGHTRDDAAGEAFDKAARLMGLPYPGGPEISRLAQQGNCEAIAFPRAIPQKNNLDFSFSGLKTAVSRYLHENPNSSHADIAASLQEAIADALVHKTAIAVKKFQFRDVIIAGGVAANRRIREKMRIALPSSVNLHIPEPKYCTDNGAMVASLGLIHFKKGNYFQGKDIFSLSPSPRTENKGEPTSL